MKHNILMLAVSMVLLVTMNGGVSAEETKNDQDCEQLTLGSVELGQTLPFFNELKRCVQTEGHATAYIYGPGGGVDDAIGFFDLVRTSKLSGKITFIGVGKLASSANIIWLAASERVVLPGTTFMFHQMTLNLSDEDVRTRTSDAVLGIEQVRRIVEMVVGPTIAEEWSRIIRGDEQGEVIGAEEALRIGWATNIRPYQ